jgi:hypothetical protein
MLEMLGKQNSRRNVQMRDWVVEARRADRERPAPEEVRRE